ncbi:MAG: serine/threonine-protein kinase [Myxococcota bacterium]|nr:serine/threonine-protein kinase [Myxococcota bacterium]
MLKQGTIISDRYRIDRFIDSGQMGEVYASTRLYDELKVAIKLIHPRWINSQEQLERFRLEVVAARKVEHPAVVEVLDVGEYGERPFMVMEFLRGTSLADYLASGSLRRREAFEIIRSALQPLAKAHEVDVIHRDFKPENIFVVGLEDADNRVKLLDFGIARELGSVRKTRTGMTMGTPLYMSPEQAADPKNVRFASDIWATGVMLYRFATGLYPFTGTTPTALLIATVIEPHTPASAPHFNLPVQLSLIIERCLEKEPTKRFANGAELLEALTTCMRTPSVAKWLDENLRLNPDADDEDDASRRAVEPTPVQGKETMPSLDGQSLSDLVRPAAASEHASAVPPTDQKKAVKDQTSGTDSSAQGKSPAHLDQKAVPSAAARADDGASVNVRPTGPENTGDAVHGQRASTHRSPIRPSDAASDVATWHQEPTSSDELEETIIHLLPQNTTDFDDATSRIETDIEVIGRGLQPVTRPSALGRYVVAVVIIAIATGLGLLVRNINFTENEPTANVTPPPKARSLAGHTNTRLPDPSEEASNLDVSPPSSATKPNRLSKASALIESTPETLKPAAVQARSSIKVKPSQKARRLRAKAKPNRTRRRPKGMTTNTQIGSSKRAPKHSDQRRDARSRSKKFITQRREKAVAEAKVRRANFPSTKSAPIEGVVELDSALKTTRTGGEINRVEPAPPTRIQTMKASAVSPTSTDSKRKRIKPSSGRSTPQKTDTRKAQTKPFMSF